MRGVLSLFLQRMPNAPDSLLPALQGQEKWPVCRARIGIGAARYPQAIRHKFRLWGRWTPAAEKAGVNSRGKNYEIKKALPPYGLPDGSAFCVPDVNWG